jgi:hypothetical protein
MGVYDELASLDSKPPTRRKKKKSKSTKRSASQPIDQSASRSTDRSIDQPIDLDSLGPVVDRPRAFYITQRIDRWLNEAVRYLKGKGLHKVDRSVVVNTLMHDGELFKPKQLDRLRQKVLAHLTNKSLKRVESTD